MASLIVLAASEEDRRDLALIAGEAGHLVHAAGRLEEAVELIFERRARGAVVVDSPGSDARLLVREVLRAAPLLPVVVALKVRDAERAVELLRAGAFEVVAPPWTRESLRACLGKAARLSGTAYALREPWRARAASLYLMAALVFFASAFGVLAARRQARLAAEARQTRTSWELPIRHPAALAFDGKELWLADWFSQTLYRHDPLDLKIQRLVHFTNETPVALAFGRDAAFTASAGGVIARRLKDGDLAAIERAPGFAGTVGLAYDGLYLWSLDRKGFLRKHLPDAQWTVLASYPAPGEAPAALTFDGKDLWSLDAGNRELLRHNLERPDEVTARVPLPEYSDGRYWPVGLGFDGERFWSVGTRRPESSGPARVFRHAAVGP